MAQPADQPNRRQARGTLGAQAAIYVYTGRCILSISLLIVQQSGHTVVQLDEHAVVQLDGHAVVQRAWISMDVACNGSLVSTSCGGGVGVGGGGRLLEGGFLAPPSTPHSPDSSLKPTTAACPNLLKTNASRLVGFNRSFNTRLAATR